MKNALLLLFSFTVALAILLFFDVETLFLAALLLSLIAIKKERRALNTILALWFALSVAPASKIELENLTLLSNGFLIQAVVSLLLFLYFNTKKPSLIGRLHQKNNPAATVSSAVLAGFAAGISSALLWQAISSLALL